MGERNLVYGLHAVRWLLKCHPERVRHVWVRGGREDGRVQEIAELARTVGISVQRAEARVLDQLDADAVHQGVIADVQPSQAWTDVELMDHLENLEGAPPLLLILDGVQDPHNLGACLRTADACGVHAVVVPRDRAAGLTPTVRKVAAGAAETVPLVTVTNLARTLRSLKERNIWLAGTAADAEQTTFDAKLTGALGVVMGSEGEGLRRLTRESCDFLVRLPMGGAVESLNVSVATGMVLYEVLRQRAAGAR
jgi:23S rRNA (guanosine2251-2'-O)-methyltransferase